MSAGTEVILLGTGTPNAEPERSGPAVALITDGRPYLVDFGPGVVRRAAMEGLDVTELNRAFLTHLHSDHTAGYPDLILTPWVLERDERLEVYGPEGIRAMTEHILAAYQQDIDERLHGLEPANDRGYLVNVHEIEPGIVYRDSNVTVSPGSRASLPARNFNPWQPGNRMIGGLGDGCRVEQSVSIPKSAAGRGQMHD